jgi:hypothetical protein
MKQEFLGKGGPTLGASSVGPRPTLILEHFYGEANFPIQSFIMGLVLPLIFVLPASSHFHVDIIERLSASFGIKV